MENKINETKDPIEPSIKWVIIVSIGMIILWFANLFWGIWALDNDAKKGGEWGDIFGAVNALFSGAAFIMIFRGYEMQRYEVKLAKRELEESKKQTKAQKFALDEQNNSTKRQMFENTFFKLMELIDQARANISYGNAKLKGYDAIKLIVSSIRYSNTHIAFSKKQNSKENPDDIMSGWAFDFVMLHAYNYIKYLEEILIFLFDMQNIVNIDQSKRIMDSLLTKEEKILLMLTSEGNFESQKIITILNSFNLTDNVTEDDRNFFRYIFKNFKNAYGSKNLAY